MIKEIKSVIEFELTTNKYLWKLAQDYVNKVKPAFISVYSKYFKIQNLNKKIKPLTSLKNTKLQITVSTACNANCVFCAYKYFENKRMIMSFNIFKKMIDDFAESGGYSVDLIPTFGENLINKDFFKMIKYAKSKNLFVTIFTNGILLNKNNNYKKLAESNPDFIYISVGDINAKIDSEIYDISIKSSKERWKGIFKLLDYCPIKDRKKIKI
jgi:MoaA/NifB/PqqE/SkfB family radical SAM enzyme